MVLAWSVFVGGVLQLGFRFRHSRKSACFRAETFLFDPGVRRILVLMAPAALASRPAR